MKSTVKQLKKWKLRQAKQETDLNAIYEDYLRPGEIMREERSLASKGNIEEAAMVVSLEGMKFFMAQFRNMFKEELQNASPQLRTMVRQAVREEIATALREMLNVLEASDESEKSVEPSIKPTEAQKVVSEPEPELVAEKAHDTPQKKRITKDEQIRAAAIVVSLLRRHSTQRLKELMDELSKHGFVDVANPTMFLKQLMKVDPRIVRVERGLIGLEE
jgi:hypothetical protein